MLRPAGDGLEFRRVPVSDTVAGSGARHCRSTDGGFLMRVPRPWRSRLLGVLLTLSTTAAAATETLVFGHILAESTAHHRNLLWAAEQIEQRTDGRYRLDVFPAGQIGTTDAQVIEGFKTGTADLAYLSFGHLLKVFPTLSIGAGPFVFRDFDHWQLFAASDLYREQVAAMDAALGLKSFGLAYYGARHVTTREPLPDAAAIEDLVIRVPNIPTMILTFRALGAQPVPLPFKETYQALSDGVVDAQENPLPAIKAMRFYEVTPAINLTAHILDAQIIVMDADRWSRIGAADQHILAEILDETARRVTRDVRREELALEQELTNLGARLHPIERKPLIDRIRPLHHSHYFPWGGAIYDRIQALGEP
jgi:TRAP-type C4-dicarboxylate transport system substrate-binding protein